MSQDALSARECRLLVVAPPEGRHLLNATRLAACLEGAKFVGVATDCNDGLRLTLMTYPDVIVLPWSAEAPKLLQALDHLRSPHFSPRIVVVANRSEPLEGFALSEAIILVEANPLHPEESIDSLRAALADKSVWLHAGSNREFTDNCNEVKQS